MQSQHFSVPGQEQVWKNATFFPNGIRHHIMISARKVPILLTIGDQEFTFGELSMKAGCHLGNKNYDF
jgi:hypothetical protein